jgi:rhodanese-related sulfurtransferase
MTGVDQVGPDVVAATIADGGRVIDVREPFEVAAGHIEGVEHIPMHLVPLRLDEMRDGQPLHIVCASGNRSWQVANFLLGHGITAVNVAGGMQSWVASGRPTKKGPVA